MENSLRIPEKFESVIIDFANDLSVTFPEYKDRLEKWQSNITPDSLMSIYKYCLTLYPKHFFNILYQNDDIFKDNSENTQFFPDIEFSELFHCEGVSGNTKKTIWKYLQLILFTIIQDVKDKANFGDSMNIFDGINDGELQEKLKETMESMSDFFSKMKNSPFESSHETAPDSGASEPNPFEEFKKNFPMPENMNMPNMPNMENVHDHLQSLFNGKIGALAKEMAEEITDEFKDILGEEAANLNNTEDAMKLFMKDPKKLISLMKKISTKLDEKMKNGDVSKEEMMKEASEMMNKMKEMGGGENMKEMFEKFAKGMGGLGKNARLDTNAIARMTSMEENRNRMRSKMQHKKEKQQEALEKMKLDRQKLLAAQNEVLSKMPGYSLDAVSPDNLIFKIDGQEGQEKSLLVNNAEKMAQLLIAEEEAAMNKPKAAKKKNKKTK